MNKHTEEYAKQLANEHSPVLHEEYFIKGYMMAVEHNNAAEVQEALKGMMTVFEEIMEKEYSKPATNDPDYVQAKLAIEKATK